MISFQSKAEKIQCLYSFPKLRKREGMGKRGEEGKWFPAEKFGAPFLPAEPVHVEILLK